MTVRDPPPARPRQAGLAAFRGQSFLFYSFVGITSYDLSFCTCRLSARTSSFSPWPSLPAKSRSLWTRGVMVSHPFHASIKQTVHIPGGLGAATPVRPMPQPPPPRHAPPSTCGAKSPIVRVHCAMRKAGSHRHLPASLPGAESMRPRGACPGAQRDGAAAVPRGGAGRSITWCL